MTARNSNARTDPQAGCDDPFDLGRFVTAQADTYDQALAELRRGKKHGHWMWSVFPQFDGLGSSPVSRRYAVKSLDEARAYLAHPVLGARLRECADTLLRLAGRSASDILPYPDDLKLQSSMTLFELVAGPGAAFSSVLDAYFLGRRDDRTLNMVTRASSRAGQDGA
jgi:uncharacterized protein (DUF1810 family)